ncbi:MAG: hypothetical protein CFE49_00230 [Pseudomonas sp. PGPPP3]|nr:MAG: hypothetical protein CFE49_00230 [Pseudomonas sp. PGPPP3]
MLGQMSQEAVRRLTENSLLGSILSVDDVVNYVLFVASDDARNVNGQILTIDGGSR